MCNVIWLTLISDKPPEYVEEIRKSFRALRNDPQDEVAAQRERHPSKHEMMAGFSRLMRLEKKYQQDNRFDR